MSAGVSCVSCLSCVFGISLIFSIPFLKVKEIKGIQKMAMCVSCLSCVSCVFFEIFSFLKSRHNGSTRPELYWFRASSLYLAHLSYKYWTYLLHHKSCSDFALCRRERSRMVLNILRLDRLKILDFFKGII